MGASGTRSATSTYDDVPTFSELLTSFSAASRRLLSRQNGVKWLYGHRYYSPTLGRWLSMDPSVERQQSSSSSLGSDSHRYVLEARRAMTTVGDDVNLYVFVGNSPLGAYDLLGLYQVCCRRSEGPDGGFFRHCEVKVACGVKDNDNYDAEIDKTCSRSVDEGAIIGPPKPCCCAKEEDLHRCLFETNPYDPGEGRWGNNCQANTVKRLAKCCLKSNWRPNCYAGNPRGRCLKWEYRWVPLPEQPVRVCVEWEYPEWRVD